MQKILRVFCRKTSLTPDDEDVRINEIPTFFDEADEIHISVTFNEDLRRAEFLAKAWECVAPVKIGGPATGEKGGNFVPGMYLKKGAVITSRGCPNRCWFCSVWRREGNIVRELPITEGCNILDDNFLRCSEKHIRSVFAMLKEQKEPIRFTGGLEAKVLQDWHIDLLEQIKLDLMYFAYDTLDDFEPLKRASKMLRETNFSMRSLRVYCLVGYPNDTFELAEKRLQDCVKLGFVPMAMLFNKSEHNKEWHKFQREWARPKILFFKVKQIQSGMC
jgi:hypothetical protein